MDLLGDDDMDVIIEEENSLSIDADEGYVKERLSTILTSLKENISNTENRLHIQRKKLWDDLLHIFRVAQTRWCVENCIHW